MYAIFDNVPYKELHKGSEFSIEGMEYDSRKIKENNVFIAMSGSMADGHDFIQKAIDSGAMMIVTEKEVVPLDYLGYQGVSFIMVEGLRKKLGIIASNYYGYPQKNIKIIGITGTNGKTTSSYIMENILERTARIGTTGNRILNEEFPAVNTTPESLELIRLISESVRRGAEYFIMEVSSHGLETGRVDMLEFDSAIFTNLTQDHLDFHGTMENYFHAKKKIFNMLKKDGHGVINIDDSYGKKIYDGYNDALVENTEELEYKEIRTEKVAEMTETLQGREIQGNSRYVSISIKDREAHLYGEILSYTNEGMKLKVTYKGKEHVFEVSLIGEYNLSNMLGCIAAGINLGLDIDTVIKRLSNIGPVPGRFETIKNSIGARLVVDFAHTDDGLINVGNTLRKITEGRVITLFGAGGDRDRRKRPKMAKAAASFSDFIILTSDNPRTENPLEILEEIKAGLTEISYPEDRYIIIEDREEAIKHAIRNIVGKGDSLLVAGKGHETYQIIGKEKRHFDDREVIKKYLI